MNRMYLNFPQGNTDICSHTEPSLHQLLLAPVCACIGGRVWGLLVLVWCGCSSGEVLAAHSPALEELLAGMWKLIAIQRK